jgi:hypothetical protein
MNTLVRSARILLAAAPALALVVACDDGTPVDAVQTKIALSRLSTCAEVERHIEDQLVEESRRNVEDMKQYRDYGFGWGVDDGLAQPGNAEDGNGNGNGSGAPDRGDAPTDYTDTNTQEAGVDEADFVKTNGVRTFVLTGNRLYATQTWPPETLAVEGSLELAGNPREMFLTDDDQIVVFAHDWAEVSGEPGRPGIPEDCWQWGCYGGRSFTRVTVIDASGATLRKRYDLELNGDYRSSRRIGDSVRIVVGETIARPQGIRYWPDESSLDWDDDAAWDAALDRMHERNVQLIRAADLTDFLPQSVRVDDAGNETVLERDCARFHVPNAPVPLGLTTLATLEVDFGTLHRTSVFGDAHTIYASEATLYMGSNHWWWRPSSGQTTHTYVHAFDLSNDLAARYRGSFGVPGTLLNQFSMDEHAGHIRVATHVREFTFSMGDDWQPPRLTNRVTVFRKDDFGFTETGRTPDLAPNEQIFSARMEGDRGFVVTFERVDPLFTLDLSDPSNPRVIGELKVPGFSTYIHFLDDDHLLTIGQHVPDASFPDAPDEWGLKLTVFDVSNFANPTEKYVQYLGEGYSDASWDHKAFNYFPAKKTLAIPMARWTRGWDHFVSELQLYRVDAQSGISSLGAIDMSDLYPRHEDWYGWWSPHVRRSVMADDFAYAISDAGIRVAPITAPSQTIATCRFR